MVTAYGASSSFDIRSIRSVLEPGALSGPGGIVDESVNDLVHALMTDGIVHRSLFLCTESFHFVYKLKMRITPFPALFVGCELIDTF